MKKTITTIFIIVTFVLTGNLYAAEGGLYGAIKPGYFSPNGSQEGLKDHSGGYNLELVGGYKYNKNIAAEFSLGYYNSSMDKNVKDPSSFNNLPQKINRDLSVIPLTLTAKGLLPLFKDKLELFGGAGLGFYISEIKQEVNGACSEDEAFCSFFSSTTENNAKTINDNVFGYHIEAGSDYSLRDNFGVGLNLKWFRAKSRFFSDQDKTNIGGLLINLGAKFIF